MKTEKELECKLLSINELINVFYDIKHLIDSSEINITKIRNTRDTIIISPTKKVNIRLPHQTGDIGLVYNVSSRICYTIYLHINTNNISSYESIIKPGSLLFDSNRMLEPFNLNKLNTEEQFFLQSLNTNLKDLTFESVNKLKEVLDEVQKKYENYSNK